MCRYGKSCSRVATATCLWSHPPAHRNQTARVDEMTRALRYEERIDVGVLAVEEGLQTAGITQDRELASFNKVSDSEIAVPGWSPYRIPPVFRPPTRRLKLRDDAQNMSLRAVFPRYTHCFEPLLRAVEVMRPDVDLLATADMVSNAGNMAKLLRLVQNTRVAEERFDLEWRGGTLLLSRWNDDPKLSGSCGFGAGFERATCRYARGDEAVLRHSASHHRVVSYCFAGLTCVVQSEVDAYWCGCHASLPRPRLPRMRRRQSLPRPRLLRMRRRQSLPRPRLLRIRPRQSFLQPRLPRPAPCPCPPRPPRLHTTTAAPLHMHRAGRAIPARCLVEVKTHARGSSMWVAPEPQLYFGRRTQLFVAQHKRGEEEDGGEVVDMTAGLAAWEAQEQAALQRLAALLRALRARVEGLARRGVARVSLVCVCDGSGRDDGAGMRLFERTDGEGLLPPGCG
ncbi:hypothetical protein BT67DRAFT_387832 [Trichocladium antarcticum]|uniref:Uncharacterized protein n=1 Tax=Trichocladium antarcticum TaxID=1450529 RepID=A0AAN6ZA60_9PEZI|nr:hypothetical protein BT67DRAFT_387832 [Trichocladium antarcticum]